MSDNSSRSPGPSFSFSTSEKTLYGYSKNSSGCANIRPYLKNNLSFQSTQKASETPSGHLNLSNQTQIIGSNPFLPARMRENSLTSHFSLNLNLESSNNFEYCLTNIINEESKFNENGKVPIESSDDEGEGFGEGGGSHSLNLQRSLKSGLEGNATEGISDIENNREEMSEDEDDEEDKNLKECLGEITNKVYDSARGLIQGLGVLKKEALRGELCRAYDGLIQINQKNPAFFKREKNEDYFSVKFYETLILFLCCRYKEALLGLLDMKDFYENNPGSLKIGIDIEDEEVGDDDIGALYHKIGKCKSELGNREQGIKDLEEALRILEKSLKDAPEKQPFLLMNCLCSLTQHYLKYGDDEKAKERVKAYSQRALLCAKQLKEPKEGMAPINQSLARCEINYCDALLFIEDQEKAEEELSKAKDHLIESLDGHPLESHHMGARIKRSQAQIDWRKRKYDSAIKLYKEAVGIIQKTMPLGTKLEEDYLDELQKLIEEKEKYLAEVKGEPESC